MKKAPHSHRSYANSDNSRTTVRLDIRAKPQPLQKRRLLRLYNIPFSAPRSSRLTSDKVSPNQQTPSPTKIQHPGRNRLPDLSKRQSKSRLMEQPAQNKQNTEHDNAKRHFILAQQSMAVMHKLLMACSGSYPLKDLPRPVGYERKKTIVFDLDETLVHCCLNDESQGDVQLSIVLPNMMQHTVSISIRPYLADCLKYANKHFEVVVFTASQACYADVVLDYLDPEGTLIHHRLYREDCCLSEGVYVKDLRILDRRELKDVAIVDNSLYSFAYQIDNGIPISTWVDDRKDRELMNLVKYMRLLRKVKDVRELNRRAFKLGAAYNQYAAADQSVLV